MPVIYVNTIAEMTASSAVSGDTVIVGGYNAISDGGGGYFQCADAPIPSYWIPADRGLIFSHDDGDRWFQRIVDTPYISVKWFGAYGDNNHDDADAINRAFNAALNHGTTPTICDSGNTAIEISATGGVSASGTRTRIYFPSGIYRISMPIARQPNQNSFVPYPANCLEIIGEQSAVIPYTSFAIGQPPALMLDPENRVRISGMSFSGFPNAIRFQGTHSARVVMDNVGFTEVSNVAIEMDCPSVDFVLNYMKWYPVQYAIWQKGGNVNVVGGWLCGKSFIKDHDGMIIVEKGNFNIENVMGVPSRESEYFDTCAWIKNIGGNIRCENMRFGGEHLVAHAVINYAKGQVYVYKAKKDPAVRPVCITFIDCLFSPIQAVRLMEIPNSIIFENGIAFNFFSSLITYGGSGSFEDKLDEMAAHFSVKVDNVPYFGGTLNGAGWQANSLDSIPYPLLPYLNVNNGLDSYGYAYDDDCEMPVSQPLKFFMGKLSHDGTIFSGIYGDYSYEVHLTNTTNYQSVQNHPETTGSINQYNAYRIEVVIDRSIPSQPKTKVKNVEVLTPGGLNTDLDAPVLFQSSQNPNLIEVNTYNNHSTTNAKRKFGIFYEIRNLIPPSAVPFGGIN